MSPIPQFNLNEIYSPQFSETMAPVEEPNPLLLMRKLTRRHQKKALRNDEEQQSTAWTPKEEITLCKAWVRISYDNVVGNARKYAGFWNAILARMHIDCPITHKSDLRSDKREMEDGASKSCSIL